MKKMEKNEIVVKVGRYTLEKDGILRFETAPNTEINLAEAKECIAAAAKLVGNKRVPLYADMRNIKSIDKDAALYFAGEEPVKTQSACAKVVSSTFEKVIGNFFMFFNKPLIPIKLFTDEVAALEWLKGSVWS